MEVNFEVILVYASLVDKGGAVVGLLYSVRLLDTTIGNKGMTNTPLKPISRVEHSKFPTVHDGKASQQRTIIQIYASTRNIK